METQRAVPRTVELSILDATVRLTTDSPELLRTIGDRLGPFVSEGDARHDDVEVRMSPHPPRLRIGSKLVELRGRHPSEQAFSAIFRTLVDRVESHLLVHAASLAAERGAFLLAGSSGTGKTTLCLMLARRGFRVLSDDFTPLERSTGCVVPFPKALGVRRGAGSDAALKTAGTSISGPRGLLAHDGLPESARAAGPAPLAGVVFLDLDPSPVFDPLAPLSLAVRCAGPPREIGSRLAALAGVEPAGEQGDELFFRIDPASASSARLERELADLGPATIEYGLVAPNPPRSDQPPLIEPIATAHAALLLLRELQNRRPGGRLLRSVDGDVTALLPEVARAIAGLPVARLRPGAPEETAELLERTFRGWSGDPA